jgi:hypothetical protein
MSPEIHTFKSQNQTLVSGYMIDKKGVLYKHLDTDYFICDRYSSTEYKMEDKEGHIFWGDSRTYRYPTLDEFLKYG